MENPCYFNEFWYCLEFLLSLLFLLYFLFLLYISASSFLKTFFAKTVTQICGKFLLQLAILVKFVILAIFSISSIHFGARKRRTGEDGGLKRRKNLLFSKISDTCLLPHVKTLKVRHFHVVIVWWRQRNAQKNRDARASLLGFWLSRCRRRRRILMVRTLS